MTTEDAWQAALDANPYDHVCRLAFADWLEERGDPRAAGYRELGRLQMCPHKGDWFFNNGEWWWREWEMFCPHPSDYYEIKWLLVGYGSRRAAEDAAALAYAKLQVTT